MLETFYNACWPGLRDSQLEVLRELDGSHSVFLNLHCGFGKTVLATHMAFAYSLRNPHHRVIMLAPSRCVFKQWCQTLLAFKSLHGIAGDLDEPSAKSVASGALDPHSVKKVHNPFVFESIHIYMPLALLRDAPLFADSPCVLFVDEFHSRTTAVASIGSIVRTSYFFGLSGSMAPFDDDNPPPIPYMQTIIRREPKDYDVFMVTLRFQPEVKWDEPSPPKNPTGINYTHMINSLHTKYEPKIQYHELYNYSVGCILNIILMFIKRFGQRIKSVLVLFKNVDRIKSAEAMLKHINFTDYGLLYGERCENHMKARIIFATYGKASTGYDNPHLNTLVLADNIENPEQSMGRLRPPKGCYIIDLSDSDPTSVRPPAHRFASVTAARQRPIQYFRRHQLKRNKCYESYKIPRIIWLTINEKDREFREYD